MKLYYSQGSCSLASHIALEEAGARFESQRIDLGKGEQRSEAYKQINAKGKVPALRLDSGEVLTENPAIISYVADTHPAAGLLDAPGTLPRARAQEWMAWCASTVHPSFGPLFVASRAKELDAVQKAAVEQARATVQANLTAFDAGLAGKRFVLGERFSAADAYSPVFYLWGTKMGFTLGEHHRASVRALLARAGVGRAVATQELSFDV